MPASRHRHAIILTAVFLLLTIAAGGALVLERLHRGALTTADDVVQRAASVMESMTNRLFLQVDGTLLGLPMLMAETTKGQQLDQAAASRILRNLTFQNLNFRDLLLVQPDGRAWAAAQQASIGRPIPVASDQLGAAPRSGGVAITGPVRNPATGEWALFFARPVTLVGIGALYAVAEVPVPLITTLLASAAEMRGLRASVERADGQLLVGLPHDESRIGVQLNPPVESLPTGGQAFEIPGRFGPEPAIAAARPTLYRTIFVTASLDKGVAFAEWERDRDRVVAIAAGISLVVFILAAALALVLHQRRRTVIERLRSRAMLESAIESMSDGFVMFDAEDRLIVCNSRFRDLYALSAKFIVPGAAFADIIREGAKRGQYPQAGNDPEGFTRRTVAWHRGDHPPMERLLPGGRWLLITERRMPDGGTVGIRTDITAQKQAMREVALSERRFRALAKAGAVVTWLAAADGTIVEAPGWEALTGQPEEALRDGSWLSAVHPDDRTRVSRALSGADEGAMEAEFRVLAGGSWRWIRSHGVPVYGDHPGKGPVEWVGTIHDVHDRRTAQEALAESEARFVRAITSVGMGTWDWDLATDVLHLSPGFEALYDRALGSLPTARAAAALVHPEDSSAFHAAVERALAGANGGGYDIEFRIAKPGCEVKWLRTQGRAERDATGRPIRMSGVAQDVTAKRTVELRLAHMARHDALTGLPNRVLLREAMDSAVDGAKRGERCAIFCLDLDRFKQVNDTLGHPVGDALLRAVTERLLGSVRETDLVARIGGDEFAIVQRNVDQPTSAEALARRIIGELGRTFDIEGNRISIGTSVGIAVAPQDGDDVDRLLRNADLALYRAKVEGRSQFRLYEPDMDARAQARHSLERDLRRALAEQEFEVVYQPFVDVRTRRATGFEALLRWRHPLSGIMMPDEFMATAEELGLVGAIGRLVLHQACAEAVRWPDNLRIAVNLSPSQFADVRLTKVVADALRLSGLSPSRLELEITETVLLHDNEEMMASLRALEDLGVTFSMDDFGTGYSSLSYLRKFPFKKVKIDKSFVRELGVNRGDTAIVHSILDLCHRLGMRTTAEGVETEQQLEWLAAAGCMEAQGFLISPALPPEDLPMLLRKLKHDASRAETSAVPDRAR